MERTIRRLGLAVLLIGLCAAEAGATNGMYLVSYGAETGGRGGANLAISDRTLALNFNPAGIAQLQGNHMAVSLASLAPRMDSSNLVNPSTDANDQLFPLPAIGYVRGGNDSPWTWGFGLVAQGGMGARYEELNTFFGTSDELFSEVRFMSLIPTFAYSLSEDMAVGLAANLGYSDVAFRFYPETSFFNTAAPQNSFFGVRMEPAGGFQYNLRGGWWWRPHPDVTLGAVYQTETESEFSGGDTEVDFSAHPLLGRKVGYEADVEGFTFAAQAGVGVAVRTTRRTIVAVDLKRYFWDDAIDTILVKAADPDVAGAPPEVVLPFVFDWEDQWVVAIGMDFRANDRLTLRGGYNWGENPVPDHTLTPLFPATVEHHLTLGAAWLRGSRTWEVALEHAFANERTNPNPDPRVNPFGPGSTVGHSQWTLSFGVSWAWARGGRT